MGVKYSTFPINDEVREWLVEEGLHVPDIDGRSPTPNEIRDALKTLGKQTVSYNIGEYTWQAQIYDLAAPETGPWAQVNVLHFEDADEPCDFYFPKGWPELIIEVVHRISQISGPIAVVPDTGCPAAIVEPSSIIERILATWKHLSDASEA